MVMFRKIFKKKKSTIEEYLDEAVYGANDGIITTFAVISAGAGATLGNDAIIIVGIANLIADGFSMGASSFLSIKTADDVERIKSVWKRKSSDALRPSLVTFGAFVVAGVMPLVPFFSSYSIGREFIISAIASGIAFFIIGGLRSVVTKRGFFISGVEMFIVGGVASFLAYSVGFLVEALIS